MPGHVAEAPAGDTATGTVIDGDELCTIAIPLGRDAPPEVARWRLDDGSVISSRPVDADLSDWIPAPLMVGAEGRLLVSTLRRSGALVAGIDVETGEATDPVEAALGLVLPAPDGATFVALRMAGRSQILEIERWDAIALERRSAAAVDVAPRFRGETRQIALTPEGSRLVVQEAEEHAILVFDIATGGLAARFAPQGRGSVAFDLTPDGGTIVAITGAWQEEVLVADAIATIELPPPAGMDAGDREVGDR